MNVFDIIGPIMIGPSSSHTAGAVKIGFLTRELMGEKIVKAEIKLHGSFAATYKGHGTDKALVAGLLGMLPDDERIKNSFESAKNENMTFEFSTIKLEHVHPNTVIINAIGKSGKTLVVQGSSVGGGEIVITKLNGMDVNFSGNKNTLVIFHKDTLGEIALVSELLANNEINIAEMRVSRNKLGGEATMVIETDQQVDHDLKKAIEDIANIYSVSVISKMQP